MNNPGLDPTQPTENDWLPEQNRTNAARGRAIASSQQPLPTPIPLSENESELEKARRFYALREGNTMPDGMLKSFMEIEYGAGASAKQVNEQNARYADRVHQPIEIPDFMMSATGEVEEVPSVMDVLKVPGATPPDVYGPKGLAETATSTLSGLTYAPVTLPLGVTAWGAETLSRIIPDSKMKNALKAESAMLHEYLNWWMDRAGDQDKMFQNVLGITDADKRAREGEFLYEMSKKMGSTAGYLGIGKAFGPIGSAMAIAGGLYQSAYQDLQQKFPDGMANQLALMYTAIWAPLEALSFEALGSALKPGGLGRALGKKFLQGIPQGVLETSEQASLDWLLDRTRTPSEYLKVFATTILTTSIVSGAIGVAGRNQNIGRISDGLMEGGMTPTKAMDYATRLVSETSQAARENLIEEMYQQNPVALMRYSLREATETLDIFSDEVAPYTVGEIQAVRAVNSDAEIDAIVSEMDADVQQVALEAFKNPTQESIDALNDLVAPVMPDNLKVTPAEVEAVEAPSPAVEAPAKDPASMNPKEFDKFHESENRRLGGATTNERSFLNAAFAEGRPVNAELFDRYNNNPLNDRKLKLPEGYERRGNQYVQPQLYRGTTLQQWEAIQRGEQPQSEFTTDGNTWVTTSLDSAKGYTRETGKNAVIIEYKGTAHKKVSRLTDDKGDHRRQGPLTLEDVSRVTDGNGNVIYDAQAPSPAVEAPAMEADTGHEIFSDLSNSEFIQHLAVVVNLTGGSDGLQADHMAELQRRSGGDADALRAMLRQLNKATAEMNKKYEAEKVSPSFTIPELAHPSISDRAAELQERGWRSYQQGIARAVKNLVDSEVTPQRIQAYAKEAGMSYDQARAFLEGRTDAQKITDAHTSVARFADALFKAVKQGDATTVRALLKQHNFHENGMVWKKMEAAAGAFELAKKVDNESVFMEQRTAEAEAEAETEAPVVPEAVHPSPARDARSVQDLPDTHKPSVARKLDANILWQSPASKETRARAEALFNRWIAEVDMNAWNPSFEEMSSFMDYVAAMQEYAVEAPQISAEAQAFLERAQAVLEQTADLAEQMQEQGIQFGFNRRQGFYFPMATMLSDIETISYGDVMDKHTGWARHRKKSPDYIRDPFMQVVNTLYDRAMALQVAQEVLALKNQGFSPSIDGTPVQSEMADAFVKAEKGETLTPQELSALGLMEKIQDATKLAETLGIEDTKDFSPETLRLIAMHNKDGKGQEVNKVIGIMSNPFMLAEKMDASNLDKPFETGPEGSRFFGANSSVFADNVINPTKRIKQDKEAIQTKMLDYIRDIPSAERKVLGEKLYDLLMDNRVSRKDIFRKADRSNTQEGAKAFVDYLRSEYNLSETEALMTHAFAKHLVSFSKVMAANPDMSNEIQRIKKGRRKEFAALEQMIKDGSATDQDIEAYLAFAPSQPLVGQQNMMRNVMRQIFERKAVDHKDFFGYFDSMMEGALRAQYYGNASKNIEAWASYLDRIGQKQNAALWRARIEQGLKGEMFAWEDRLLKTVASGIKQGTEKAMTSDAMMDAVSKLHMNDAMNILKNTTVDRLEARMVEAMNMVQRARVNAWLTGNIGWTLFTQPLSLLQTVKQAGTTQTMKAALDILLGNADVSESDVVFIKSAIGKGGVELLESVSRTGQFEEGSIVPTKRQKVRNVANIAASSMESYLTKVAYLAGRTAGQEMGMTEKDAHYWGERVAGSTQSMYDIGTRTLALDSNLLRAWKPMQTYVFDAASGILDSLNVTGVDRSAVVRARELLRFMVGCRLMSWLWSVVFGQDWKQAIYDPRHAKTTVGSNIPFFGQDVDIQLSQILPWVADQSWKQSTAAGQFSTKTQRLFKSAIRRDPHTTREALSYGLSYITPFAGIPGSVPADNLLKMSNAVLFNDGYFEDITGRKVDQFIGDEWFRSYYNPLWWAWGVAHGRKAVGRRDSDKKKN
jgi:hypothetical protein